MSSVKALSLACGLAPALWSTSTATSLTFDEEGAKNRPVSKVVTLLKDMTKQLQKEQEEDEEIYDKLACWCETNDRDKAKAISDAEKRIKDLNNKIEELKALSARLATEIENLEKEVAENEAALATATALREKELAEFTEEEKDLLESISALKAARSVLSKHQEASFLQVSTASIKHRVENAIHRHMDLLKGTILPSQRKAVLAFLQAEPYAAQSGQIFGILSQMQETFEANLAAARKEETQAQKAYEDLKAAKEKEIKAGKDQIEKKTEHKADTDESQAQAETDLADTERTLDADQKFLAMLKEKCSLTDKEWEERQKTRQLEMEAVSKATVVLSNDDAHDTFTRTFNPSMLQSGSTANSKRREQASKVLAQAALKFNSPRLSTLAYQVKLDAFTKVKQAIDDLIAELLKQKEDEIKQKDFCVDEFNKNELQTEEKTRQKTDLLAKIADLEMQIQALADAIAKLKSEIREMQLQLKIAGEDREKQNQEFQTTVADQRATQRLLEKALNFLADFYKKQGKAALVQQEPAGPPPPPGFKKYTDNAASGGVMQMIQQIVDDAKAMEKEAIKSEEDAQKAYEGFVQETNASIEAKSKDIVNKSQEKAKKEDERVQTIKEKDAVVEELEELASYKRELHVSCDYVLKNFDLRQAARDQEVEALRQAKAILSGAKFEEFLQRM